MLRTIFLLVKILVALAIILGIAAICIVTFIDPNQYKNDISSSLEKITHRKVTIHGNLQWSLTPNLSLNVQSISVDNSPEFKSPLLTIQEANIQIDPIETLKGKVVINGLNIQGMNIKITVNENGVSNVDDVIGLLNSREELKNEKELDRKLLVAKATTLLFKKARASKVKITYENLKNGKHWIANINASTSNLEVRKYLNSLPPAYIEGEYINIKDPKLSRFQLKGTVQYSLTEGTIKLSDFDTHWQNLEINANGNLNPKTGIAQLKLAINAPKLGKVLHNLEIKEDITSNVDAVSLDSSLSIDKDEVEINNFKLNINNIEKYSGHARLPLSDTKTPISINLEANNGILENLIYTGYSLKQISEKLYSDIESFIPSKNREITGRFIAYNSFIDHSLKADTFHSKLNFKDGILRLNSASIDIGDSAFSGQAMITFNDTPTSMKLSLSSKSASLELISSMLELSMPVSGKAILELQMNSKGLDRNNLITSSKGTASISASSGSIAGISIEKSLEQINQVLVNIEKASAKENIQMVNKLVNVEAKFIDTDKSLKTNFDKLNSSIEFANGNYLISTFSLSGKKYEVDGNGKVSFIDNKVDFESNINQRNFFKNISHETRSILNQMKIPTFISGSPQHPQYYINYSRALNRSQWALKRKLEQKETQEIVNQLLENTSTSEE